MKPSTHKASARRSFLRLVGGVMAGGVGAVALGKSAAAEPRPSARGSDEPSTAACAIYCTKVCCSCCNGNKNLFRCNDVCSGTYYLCDYHSCASYCLSQNAC